ncbi:MAG: glucosamine-6-phosphate deaminase [Candidatus Riflebacteria bacterium]|nr:glucosamine-6-phosphate deaminase [Candidatus Riflebacteria bacterium]
MEVIIKDCAENASNLAAKIISGFIKKKPDTVLGLATGSTPLLVYKELIRLHKNEGLSFRNVTTFNLDEYAGLSPENPSSFSSYMKDNFFRHIDIPSLSTHIPDGYTKDLQSSCEEYEKKIAASGGIDLQLLGIGEDGHLAFNEPSSSLASRTRIKTLSEVTIKANASAFGGADKVPRHVITMGTGNILESKYCLLLAFGAKKASAVKNMVEGAVSASCPASALQLHRHAVIILDKPAAELLQNKDYYNYVYQNKPDWQRYE